MKARQQSWPKMWLMTDERMGDRLWNALDRLPCGEAGIVFRHYSLAPDVRGELAVKVAGLARARELTVGIAGDVDLADHVAADLVHNPARPARALPFSRSVHNAAEAEMASRLGAALVFVSPVFATGSHPGQQPLGISQAAALARAARVPAIALGGVNERNFPMLGEAGFYGWAGIDAWLAPDQNLNAVPT